MRTRRRTQCNNWWKSQHSQQRNPRSLTTATTKSLNTNWQKLHLSQERIKTPNSDLLTGIQHHSLSDCYDHDCNSVHCHALLVMALGQCLQTPLPKGDLRMVCQALGGDTRMLSAPVLRPVVTAHLELSQNSNWLAPEHYISQLILIQEHLLTFVILSPRNNKYPCY